MSRQRRSSHVFPLIIACLLGFALGGRYGSPTINWHKDWNVAAPPEKVFAVLSDIEAYRTWWRGLDTQVTEAGGVVKVKVKPDRSLPISFDVGKAASISPVVLRLEVRGNLAGSVDMVLTRQAQVTRISIYPEIRSVNPLYNLAGLVFYPLVRRGYDDLMKRGEEGLIWKVGAR